MQGLLPTLDTLFLQLLMGVAFIALGIALVAGLKFFLGFLKNKTMQSKEGSIWMVADRLVRAAHQKFKKEANPDKYNYVISRLKEFFPLVPDKILESFIESAVFNIKQEFDLYESIPPITAKPIPKKKK